MLPLLQLGEDGCIVPLCQICIVDCIALVNAGSKYVCRHARTLKHQQQKHTCLSPWWHCVLNCLVRALTYACMLNTLVCMALLVAENGPC